MSESFTGKYIVVGPKVYIKPEGTTIYDDQNGWTVWEDLPAGVWIWVECDPQDTGVPSHWVDIRQLVNGYTASLQEWAGLGSDHIGDWITDPESFPR